MHFVLFTSYYQSLFQNCSIKIIARCRHTKCIAFARSNCKINNRCHMFTSVCHNFNVYLIIIIFENSKNTIFIKKNEKKIKEQPLSPVARFFSTLFYEKLQLIKNCCMLLGKLYTWRDSNPRPHHP